MWIDALSDLTAEQVQSALRRFNREGNEFPTPAAVRKFAGDGEASIDDRALVAWASVRRAIRSVGAYESVDFDDRIINATIRNLGGWEVLCEITAADATWREKEFIAAYKAIIRTGIGDSAPLHGISAKTNGRLGVNRHSIRRIATGLAQHPIAARLGERKSARLETSSAARGLLTLKGVE